MQIHPNERPRPPQADHHAESIRPRYEWVADALAEALDLVEEYAQYVSPFLLQKWDHAGDLARLRGVLASAQIDGCRGEE